MQLITFTFNPSRESDFHASIALFKEHFPGAFRQGYNHQQLASRGLRVTCTSEQFCKWIYERDQMGFVNRMHQLHMEISYTQGLREHLDNNTQRLERIEPFKYSTPEATGVR